MVISKMFFLKFNDFGTFFSQKSFVWVALILFLLASGENFGQKENPDTRVFFFQFCDVAEVATIHKMI
jgi:hypothetical protein